MFKSSLAFSFSFLLSFSASLQGESPKINSDSLSFRQKITKFFFNDHSPKVHRVPSVKKNLIYLQVLGDTPWLGVGYSRRLFEQPKYLLEAGLGISLTPKFFDNHIPEPKNFSFSHHTRIVFRPQKLISPTVTYSGIWYSGDFYKEKMFNYWPSPTVGVRLGNSNSFAINLNWSGYFYKEDFLRLNGQDILEKGYKSKLLGLPSANFQISF